LLTKAVGSRHKAVVKLLLKYSTKLKLKDRRGYILLLVTVLNSREAIIKLLVKVGAKLEPKGDYNRTLLL
jgi:ankyrin repeat protein